MYSKPGSEEIYAIISLSKNKLRLRKQFGG